MLRNLVLLFEPVDKMSGEGSPSPLKPHRESKMSMTCGTRPCLPLQKPRLNKANIFLYWWHLLLLLLLRSSWCDPAVDQHLWRSWGLCTQYLFNTSCCKLCWFPGQPPESNPNVQKAASSPSCCPLHCPPLLLPHLAPLSLRIHPSPAISRNDCGLCFQNCSLCLRKS